MSYHTNAHQVADTFDTALTAGAMALGSILVQQQQARNAVRREANAIRAVAGRMAYDRVMAEHHAEQAAKALVNARADRFARQRQQALIEARRAALSG